MMRKANPDTDQLSRSLLQKAIRRGHSTLTQLVISCIIKNNDFDWLRKRLAVITFEECWTYGLDVSFEKNEQTITQHYLKIANTVKNKNAAGLGSLAYILSEGDTSVLLGNKEDKAIKIVAEAIKRPNDFWNWAKQQQLNEYQMQLVENADKGFRKAGWPWDRAFAQAAAYLAITTDIPKTHFTNNNLCPVDEFPFWVGIDKHTTAGKAAIRQAAKTIGFNANKALWIAFYLESAQCNAIEDSPWWQRELDWRMNNKLGMSFAEAREYWEIMKPLIQENLRDETENLKSKLLSFIPQQTQSVQLSLI
jgi:hypothetical protein